MAIDIVENKVHKAKHTANRLHSQQNNIAWVVANATALPFKAGAFERVICVDVIEHISAHEKVISEITRVMTCDGRAVVTTMRENRHHYLYPLVFKNHVREYTPKSLEQVCRAGGSNVVKHFSFYKPLAMAMRELQLMVIPRFNLPIVNLLINLPLALLALLGELGIGQGGGIGVVIQPAQSDKASGEF